MNDLNQLLLKFEFKRNFKEDDFYVSKSNYHPYKLITTWPKWEKNFLNIHGDKYSGKTHLSNIFLKKFKGIKIDSYSLKDINFKELKVYENIILDNFNEDVDQTLAYSLFNLIEQDNKYLIVNSVEPITKFDFKLNDLQSRTKNFLIAKIDKPDDELMFALILKNFSDRQIVIDKKLIDFIIKELRDHMAKYMNSYIKLTN